MGIEAIYSLEELNVIMEGLLDDDDRINYLWEYISDQPSSDHKILAIIYEALGKLYIRAERSRADVFEQAGGHWEAKWTDLISNEESNKDQRKALKRANISIEDIGLIELNEAFAVQSLAVMKELGLKEEITNVNGGAISLGHPLGCSGARILTTLVHEMSRRAPDIEGPYYGLATLCVGVGQGEATVIEWIGE